MKLLTKTALAATAALLLGVAPAAAQSSAELYERAKGERKASLYTDIQVEVVQVSVVRSFETDRRLINGGFGASGLSV